jgi:arylsulfatase A-like enzyme
MRALLMAALIGAAPGAAAWLTAGDAAAPPNILFIMADDHAEQAISAYGSELVQTPSIDRIAHEGVLFRNAFVTNSICAPSRAVFLTGKYSHHNRLRDNRDEFDGGQLTFPKLLQQSGYQTAIVGKWHLKSAPTGFDHSKVLIGQGEYYSPVFLDNGEEVRHDGYVTDLITDFALDYLEKRDPSRPFLLVYNHKAPHRNWMPAVRHLDMYADRDLPVPETFWDDYQGRKAAKGQDMRIADMYLSMDMKLHERAYGSEGGTGGQKTFTAGAGDAWKRSYARMTPEEKVAWDTHYDPINDAFEKERPTGRALTEWKFQRYMKDYLRCIAAVDENVGRVLDYLDQKGLAESTLVIYTSDQGFYLGEHGWYDKRFMYEESLAMPLVLRYPRAVPAGRASDSLVLNLDFAPTLLDFAGVEVPEEMQGRSLRPLLDGPPPADWRDAIYYHYYEYPHGWHDVRTHYGVRTDRYKLIRFYGDESFWELYDLATDPTEVRNVYGESGYAAIQEDLHQRLEALRTQFGDTTGS